MLFIPIPLRFFVTGDKIISGGNMVNFEEVSKRVLSDVTLNIPAGEAVGLIGASGAGKTTFIKLACGLLAPERGRVWTLGKDPVRYRKKYGRDISVFITGIPLLEGEDTVSQGLDMIRAVYRMDAEGYRRSYDELSQRLGFGAFAEKRVRDLSLGQRMRAELAAALIYEPRLIMLDEPDVGLDENAKSALSEMIRERVQRGVTVLVTSHDMAWISRVCGRIAVLDKGRAVSCGSVESLQSRFMPVNTMTVKISGRIPDLDDLPVRKFSLEGDVLSLEYYSNHVTAAEIAALLLKQTEIREMNIKKPGLEQLQSGGKI